MIKGTYAGPMRDGQSCWMLESLNSKTPFWLRKAVRVRVLALVADANDALHFKTKQDAMAYMAKYQIINVAATEHVFMEKAYERSNVDTKPRTHGYTKNE